MKRLLYLAFVLLLGSNCMGQKGLPPVIDSFKRELAKATTYEDKVKLNGYLSRLMMGIDSSSAEKYASTMVQLAEESRDRKLMVTALQVNGERYANVSGRRDNLDKSISYYTRALEMAKENKLDSKVVSICIGLSMVHRMIPDLTTSLKYATQAESYLEGLKNDSLKVEVGLELGIIFLTQDEKIVAFRKFLGSLQVADSIKNPVSIRSCYAKLSDFYANINQIDKAIDYKTKAMNLLPQIKTGQSKYNRIIDLKQIGDLYMMGENYTMAQVQYEKAMAVSDSLKYAPMRPLIYQGIINNYLNSNQPQKALDLFNSNTELADFLRQMNFSAFIDQSYGMIYTLLGKYDTAIQYYKKVAPFFTSNVNDYNGFTYNYQVGKLYRLSGNPREATNYLLKAKEIAERIKSVYAQRKTASELDTAYQLMNDYKQSRYYAGLESKYADSLNKQNKEKDVLQMEVKEEERRVKLEEAEKQRLAELAEKEKIEKKRKRDSIQLTFITITIAGLFIVLVMLGMFKVSARTIRLMGFFAFIMFFEFIFLLSKKSVYGITKGEPWKDLLFMIILAAILLPLHHLVEHKVIHYLTSHNRLTNSGKGLAKIFKRNKGLDIPETKPAHPNVDN